MGPEVKQALLVEPEFLHAEAAAANLEAAGFEVEQQTEADDAHLLLLEQQARFDIAVVTFPFQADRQPHTVQLLGHLRELSMPRIVVSALDRDDLGKAFPLRDGERYLEVPREAGRIGEVATEMLDER